MLIDKNPSFSNMSKQFYFRCQAQIKPTFCMFAKQSRHGQFCGFHFLISALNSDRDSVCFKPNGNVSQTFGPK